MSAHDKTKETMGDDVLEMAVELSSAYLSNNKMPPAQVVEFVGQVHTTLQQLQTRGAGGARGQTPAVTPQNSISDDYLICLEDGKKFKSLKRHLRTAYAMTPAEYRSKWGLPGDYPMVAPSYAKVRSAMARKMGLGQKRA